MSDILFEVKNVTKRFRQVDPVEEGSGEGKSDLEVIRDVSFAVTRGEGLAIMGPSGSGKSTLLHILAGLEAPSEGQVFFKGKPLHAFNATERAKWRSAHVGIVFQFHHLLGEFSAIENVALPLLIAGVSRKQATEKAALLLDEFNLSHRLHHHPASLSGGERQRVAIARALANDPDVILADEPTGSLDHEQGAVALRYLLDNQRRRGLTLIVVTHNDDMAGELDRVLYLQDGKLKE